MDEDVGSIIEMNKFNVDPQEIDEFLQLVTKTAETFKQKPGFVSAQLHRGIAGSTTFVYYIIWESRNQFSSTQFLSNFHVFSIYVLQLSQSYPFYFSPIQSIKKKVNGVQIHELLGNKITSYSSA